MSSHHVKRFKSYYEEITQHLECPVCLDFAKPPVKQCVNGHICCYSCGHFLVNCPTCRDQFAQSTSLINDIIYAFVERCPYKFYGCRKYLTPTDYEDHVESCAYRQIFCKICFQNVHAKTFKNHVLFKHKDQTWLGESNVLCWRNFSLKQTSQCNEIIRAFNELFWYCFTYNTSENTLNIAVQFIGPKAQAGKYIYEVDTGAHNVSDNRVTFKRTTHHYKDSVSYTLRTDGISIKQSFIASITQDNSFFLHLNLYKKSEEPIRRETRIVRTILSGS